MAADKAIVDGNVNNLAKETAQAVEKSIRMHFEKLMNTKETKDNSIEAGRKYVKAYVTFVHYVEELHNIVSGGVGHHH
jgi:predicted component of type VI protein secretion system